MQIYFLSQRANIFLSSSRRELWAVAKESLVWILIWHEEVAKNGNSLICVTICAWFLVRLPHVQTALNDLGTTYRTRTEFLLANEKLYRFVAYFLWNISTLTRPCKKFSELAVSTCSNVCACVCVHIICFGSITIKFGWHIIRPYM